MRCLSWVRRTGQSHPASWRHSVYSYPKRLAKELVRLAPEFLDKPTIGLAFEESIVWRRLDAFTEETVKIWNELIGMEWSGSDPLETLLTVSGYTGSSLQRGVSGRLVARILAPRP